MEHRGPYGAGGRPGQGVHAHAPEAVAAPAAPPVKKRYEPPPPPVPLQPPPPTADQIPFVAHFALPGARFGDVVRVEIDRDANVLLMDDAALVAYKRREKFHYVGGGYPKGNLAIGVPSEGNWHLTIDLGGSPGKVNAKVVVQHKSVLQPGPT